MWESRKNDCCRREGKSRTTGNNRSIPSGLKAESHNIHASTAEQFWWQTQRNQWLPSKSVMMEQVQSQASKASLQVSVQLHTRMIRHSCNLVQTRLKGEGLNLKVNLKWWGGSSQSFMYRNFSVVYSVALYQRLLWS